MNSRRAPSLRPWLAASLLISTWLATPTATRAQDTTLLQLAQPNQPLYDGRGRVVAARLTNGEILTARHTPQRDGGYVVVLVRYAADGRELERVEGDSGRGFGRRDQIGSIVALADGGALLSGMTWGPERDVVPYLVRLDRAGRLSWRMSGEASPRSRAGRHFFASWSVTLGDREELILNGYFRDGSFRVPGSRAWRPRRMNNPFMLRVDTTTGRVLWAKRVRSNGGALIQGDGLAVVSVNVPATRHGDPTPAFSELRLDRYDLGGRFLGRTLDRLPGAAGLRGPVVAIRDRGLAVVTETCRRIDAAGRCPTEGIVYVYDRSGRRIASHDVPAWSVMASRPAGAPMRVVGPSALRRVMVGSSSIPVAYELDILTFTDPTAAPTRARIAIPRTRFVSLTDTGLFRAVSTPRGVFLHSPSALLEAGTTTRGAAGSTLLFIADASFRPVDRLARLTSDPYPPPSQQQAPLNPFR